MGARAGCQEGCRSLEGGPIRVMGKVVCSKSISQEVVESKIRNAVCIQKQLNTKG